MEKKRVTKIEIEEHLWEDDRGWGVHLLNASGLNSKPVGDLHIVSMVPGKVRGDHYHERSTEWLLFFGGSAKLIWRALGHQRIHILEIRDSGPTLYMIPPQIEHAVVNTDQHVIYLSSISDREDRTTVKSIDLIEPSVL